MDVKEAIETRRAYRALEPVDIPIEIMNELANAARLSPSCFNQQPWRYVFVHDKDKLLKMRDAMKQGNEWTHNSSLIIVVFSKQEDDCVIRDRIYHQFDTGMATGFLILRATELGLVAHPIAGFSPKAVREILGVPEEYSIITCVIVGMKKAGTVPEMSEKQIEVEEERPPRHAIDEFVHFNRFGRE
jgi:nitroreductase